MEARGVADGERKTITVLFADIKGSTALIEDLDPEDARRIIDLALKVMMDAIHRYEGCVAQSLGEGIGPLYRTATGAGDIAECLGTASGGTWADCRREGRAWSWEISSLP